MILNWQKNIWQRLTQSAMDERLAHALLFTGVEGIGKLVFSQNFAHFLLCNNKDAALAKNEICCGECASCDLLKENTHPDLFYITPEEGKSIIKIEQVRQLSDSLNQTPKMGGFKVALINPVDALNQAGSNALLKTLEEPHGNTVLILVTEKPGTLLATIRSRCQSVVLPTPTFDEAKSWLLENGSDVREEKLSRILALCNNAPLKALELLESDDLEIRDNLLDHLLKISRGQELVQFGSKWKDVDVKDMVNYLISIVIDVGKIKNGLDVKFLSQQQPALQQLAENINSEALFDYYDKLLHLQKALQAGISLNKELLLDDLLLEMK